MLIAGVDEVGRGPLAEPVVAAAVILDKPIEGLTDSKKLTSKRREILFEQIQQQATAISIGSASVEEIDRINILQASLLAMKRAVLTLPTQPDQVQIDGQFCPALPYPCKAIIQGDRKIYQISAASIIAKVTRDRLMQDLAKKHPGYGLEKHNGYPTKQHLSALQELGVTDIHRRSFAPVKKYS